MVQFWSLSHLGPWGGPSRKLKFGNCYYACSHARMHGSMSRFDSIESLNTTSEAVLVIVNQVIRAKNWRYRQRELRSTCIYHAPSSHYKTVDILDDLFLAPIAIIPWETTGIGCRGLRLSDEWIHITAMELIRSVHTVRCIHAWWPIPELYAIPVLICTVPVPLIVIMVTVCTSILSSSYRHAGIIHTLVL